LEDARIDAEPEIVFNANMSNIIAYSQDASLVFLPFRLKGNQPLDPFDNPVELILSKLPVTALVLAAEDIELEAEPEDGKAGEIAAALDRQTDAEKQAQEAEKAAEEAKKSVFDARENLQKAKAKAAESKTDESTITELETELKEAEKQAEKATRRSAKAKAKARAAGQAVEDMGIQTDASETAKHQTSDPK
jgi:hypothetical protein